MFGILEHEADAVQTQYIGDLVRIGDDRSDAMGHNGAGEFRGRGHGAFDVHVGVDEARSQIGSFQIDDLVRFIAFAQSHDAGSSHSHICFDDFPAENVDQPRVLQQEMSRLISLGILYQF